MEEICMKTAISDLYELVKLSLWYKMQSEWNMGYNLEELSLGVMKFSYKNCLHVHIKQNLEHLLENG
jgi:hypothetical protein